MTYAGDVTPEQAYQAISDDPNAVLVDVRTKPELAYVGTADLSPLGKRVIAIEWQQFPTGEQNPNFVEELRAYGIGNDQAVYFLCRSGARSRFAAVTATSAGFERAHNIADGFEGPPNPQGQRGTQAGWKAADLPWRQS
ncbi:MAG: rhodanese-like domain-containing protein [Acidimicrobiia bacterium]